MSLTFGILFSVPCDAPFKFLFNIEQMRRPDLSGSLPKGRTLVLQNFYAAIINSRTKSEANVGIQVLNPRIIFNTDLSKTFI